MAGEASAGTSRSIFANAGSGRRPKPEQMRVVQQRQPEGRGAMPMTENAMTWSGHKAVAVQRRERREKR